MAESVVFVTFGVVLRLLAIPMLHSRLIYSCCEFSLFFWGVVRPACNYGQKAPRGLRLIGMVEVI